MAPQLAYATWIPALGQANKHGAIIAQHWNESNHISQRVLHERGVSPLVTLPLSHSLSYERGCRGSGSQPGSSPSFCPDRAKRFTPIADQPIASQIAMAGDAVRIQEMDDRRRQDIFFI
jgi:hypothetical protein